jgi:hypothetical protein
LGVTQYDRDVSYDTSNFFHRAAGEIFVGVGTGGLSTLSKAGTAARFASKTALAYDTTGNVLSAGRGSIDAVQNGLSVGNSLQIVGGGLGVGGNVAAGGRALEEIATDLGRVRVDGTATASMMGLGAPIRLAPKVNLNTNAAVGNFGVYEIYVNGALYKVGKADLDRITQSSGLPTRVHQQVRKLTEIFGEGNVTPGEIIPLGRTTTAAAKLAETARIQGEMAASGFIPIGNLKSFRP